MPVHTVREIMSEPTVAVDTYATMAEAARLMRDADIGDVLVTDNGRLAGVVTDRDLVVRGIAEGRDPGSTLLEAVYSREVVTVAPDDSIEQAIGLMRTHAVRRLPVVEDDQPVGFISLGDLAEEREPHSALADISTAEPNT